jgi:hypothetical protein
VLDVFDPNSYAHDPRTQFLNWSLMTYGAYDYAADARGYTWGAALERYADDWCCAQAALSSRASPTSRRLIQNLAALWRPDRTRTCAHAGRPAQPRARAGFNSHLRMARFDDATLLASRTGSTPELGLVRHGDQHKRGWASVSSRLSARIWACSGATARPMARLKPMHSRKSIYR